MSAEVLVYGAYPPLLHARRLILEKHGYLVFTTTNLPDALRVIMFQDIVGVIWCSSVSKPERQKGMIAVNALKPGLKNIVLSPGLAAGRERGLDRVLDSSHEPGELFTAIEAILDRRA
jgi:hypothetical protein